MCPSALSRESDTMDVEREEASVLGYYQRALDGHVYIRETLEAFLDTLGAWLRGLSGPPSILELGSHAGVVTSLIQERSRMASIVVCDDDERLMGMSRRRHAGACVAHHEGPLSELNGSFDVVISVARHHHLPHDYLADVRRLLRPGGAYVVADELCPEYCFGEAAARIEMALRLDVVGGYLLTTDAEVNAYHQTGSISPHAQALELERRRALWLWYRFVVDEAVKRGYFDIAVGELQSTHDDLITGSEAEHKFSPLVVERQFALAGFRMFSKQLVGPPDEPARQSMFVYVFVPA